MGPLLRATRAVPVVFPVVADPVGAGYVESLARPGGNATGFLSFEYSLGAKWLELLKEIAPSMTRVAVLRDPALAAGTGQFGVIQAVGQALRVEVNPVSMRDAGEIERAVAGLRTVSEWGNDRDCQRVGKHPSRFDRDARDPAQVARPLLRAVLRRRRWLDLLRA